MHRNTYLDVMRKFMIRSFRDKFAESMLQDCVIPKGFPAHLAKVVRRRLVVVDSAAFLQALDSPPGNRLEALKGDLARKPRSASMIGGGPYSGGPMRAPKTWRSSTITSQPRPIVAADQEVAMAKKSPLVHPGEILREKFLAEKAFSCRRACVDGLQNSTQGIGREP